MTFMKRFIFKKISRINLYGLIFLLSPCLCRVMESTKYVLPLRDTDILLYEYIVFVQSNLFTFFYLKVFNLILFNNLSILIIGLACWVKMSRGISLGGLIGNFITKVDTNLQVTYQVQKAYKHITELIVTYVSTIEHL